MLAREKIMEVLAAYDLTSSFRSAAALCGVDHHTVRRYVAARDAGLDPLRVVERPRVSDPFADKICEWIERSQGRVRAGVGSFSEGGFQRSRLRRSGSEDSEKVVWGLPSEGLARTSVEFVADSGEVFGGVDA